MNMPRSIFNRDHTHKTTFDAGLLIPFLIQEILPGDTLTLKSNLFARLATPIFPYMDNVYLDTHFFFVPNRLVWDNWEKFNGAQDNPEDSTDFLVPVISPQAEGGFLSDSIFDYAGIPTNQPFSEQADSPIALPFRAYNLIWNSWYRDENLQDSVDVETGDGPDDASLYSVLRRGRRKDYFTSALPWPQKGPSVLLPLGATAPVIGIAKDNKTYTQVNVTGHDSAKNDVTYAKAAEIGDAVASSTFWVKGDANNYPEIFADLSEATAATINELREAFTIQQMFELDARGGTRYIEILLAHFGVVSPDARLQRPEYLGGGSTMINVNPVAQTTPGAGESPQGNLAAFATGRARHGFHHSFVEHGFVIGIVSARADTTYQQGLNRMWSRRTRFDYYWPTLAHLGEQPILNREIFFSNDAGRNAEAWGYQERFAEYRYQPSMVTGRFRSNAAAPLDAWHLALDFATIPDLAALIPENPPIDRIIAVPSEPQFILDTYTQMKHARPMPTYSVPGLTRL